MQDFIKGCGFIILSLLVLLVIKQVGAGVHVSVKLVVIVVLFGVAVSTLGSVLEGLGDLINSSGSSKYVTVMLKSLFIGILSTVCASLCQDAGEGTLSFICILFGKLQILLLALPLIYEIFEMTVRLVEGE